MACSLRLTIAKGLIHLEVLLQRSFVPTSRGTNGLAQSTCISTGPEQENFLLNHSPEQQSSHPRIFKHKNKKSSSQKGSNHREVKTDRPGYSLGHPKKIHYLQHMFPFKNVHR